MKIVDQRAEQASLNDVPQVTHSDQPKRRGRPKGSVSKPKDEVVSQPKKRKIRKPKSELQDAVSVILDAVKRAEKTRRALVALGAL